MKKIIVIVSIILIGIGFIASLVNAQISVPSFFKRDGNNILFQNSSWELGSSATRIIKGWFTNLDATNISIGGVSSGNLDMNNNLILNIGTSTTDFTSGGGLTLAVPLGAIYGGTGLSATGTPGYVLTATGTAPYMEWKAVSAGIGGSTGVTDNAILRADGAGGSTLQSSGVTISDTNNVGIGTSTPAFDLHIIKTASSTIGIGNATHTGCMVMGDSDGLGISYLTILDGVLSATSTKPAICQ